MSQRVKLRIGRLEEHPLFRAPVPNGTLIAFTCWEFALRHDWTTLAVIAGVGIRRMIDGQEWWEPEFPVPAETTIAQFAWQERDLETRLGESLAAAVQRVASEAPGMLSRLCGEVAASAEGLGWSTDYAAAVQHALGTLILGGNGSATGDQKSLARRL